MPVIVNQLNPKRGATGSLRGSPADPARSALLGLSGPPSLGTHCREKPVLGRHPSSPTAASRLPRFLPHATTSYRASVSDCFDEMPQIDGFQCHIRTSSGELIEYIGADCEQRDFPNRVSTGSSRRPSSASSSKQRPLRTCYIQSTENEEFSIVFTVTDEFRKTHPDATTFCTFICLDGISQRLGLLQESGEFPSTNTYKGISRPLGNVNKFWPFRFGKRTVTDDASVASKVGGPQELGEIRVDIIRYKRTWKCDHACPWRCEAKRSAENAEPLEKSKLVHEKALKGRDLAHSAEMGPLKITTKAKEYWHGVDLDKPEKPYMSFRFHYRSRRKFSYYGRGWVRKS